MDQHGDGLWGCRDSPAISYGGANEHWEDPYHNDPNRDKQRLQGLRCGRGTMGIDDGVPIHYSLPEIQVRGIESLHRTNEHENVDIDRKEAY